MKYHLYLILAVFFIITPLTVHADSPITSTPFSDAYVDIPEVQRAQAEGMMNLEIAEYLCCDSTPVDVKAAVINALSWDIEGKSNAELFSYYLGLKYQHPLSELDIEALTPDEVFCLGYLLAMDDYFHPEEAIPLLITAEERNKESFTVAIVSALVKAQKKMDSDWAEVWELTEEVLKRKSLIRDMRSDAIDIIIDYMILYKDY
jgi:hypothetical protein